MHSSSVFLLLMLTLCNAQQQQLPHGTSGRIQLQKHTRIAHDTYFLGEREHPSEPGVRLNGYAFLNLHRSAVPHSSGLPRAEKHLHFNRSERATHLASHCTGPIAAGAAWQVTRGYRLHTRNSHSLTKAFLIDAMQRANDEWRCALNAHQKLVAGPLVAAIDESSGSVINLAAPDGYNDVGFAIIEGRPGTVAVTIVWGIFGGPLSSRRITEYDMVFDGVHYKWGDATQRSDVMDVQAIATHETGHSLGLDDVYDGGCGSVTMFGTSAEGETKKRSIEKTDMQGLSSLYA